MVTEDEGLHRTLRTSAFRAALAAWLSQQCDEVEPDKEPRRGDTAGSERRPAAENDEAGAAMTVVASETALGCPREASRDTTCPSS